MPDKHAPPYIDTSALVKWYLPEQHSEAVETFIQGSGRVRINAIGLVEFRCLHARKQRAGEIDTVIAATNHDLLQTHIRQGFIRVAPLDEATCDLADDLIGRLSDVPLRALDALHLASAIQSDSPSIATADRVMAQASRTLGLHVHEFI